MTYPVKVGTSKSSLLEIMGINKELDVLVDFHNKLYYQQFIYDILYNYVKGIMGNVSISYMKAKTLEVYMKKHPEMEDELQQIANELDSNQLKNDLKSFILPLPKFEDIDLDKI